MACSPCRVALPIFCPQNLNYASVMLLGTILLAMIAWVVSVRAAGARGSGCARLVHYTDCVLCMSCSLDLGHHAPHLLSPAVPEHLGPSLPAGAQVVQRTGAKR